MKHLFLLSIAACAAMTCGAVTLKPQSSVNLPVPYAERHLSESKLVESRQLNADYAFEVRELPNGAFYKTVRRTGIAPAPVRIIRKTDHMRPAGSMSRAAAEEQVTLYENFSAWDGITDDWIPDGWTEINSTDEIKTLRNGAFTWHAIDPSGISSMPNAIDGDYAMCIYHAYYKDENNQKVELAQDEWLITPEFSPATDEYLSFYLAYNPLYLFNCSNEYLDFSDSNNVKFKEKLPSTTMKILIREQGGDWVQLHDVYDDWKDGPDFQELLDNSGSSYWYYQFSLADYVGKNVQVAFQFVGKLGNVMELDAVKVSVPVVEAEYQRPQGSFYWGFSDEYELYGAVGYLPLLVPAYTDLVWSNTSSVSAIGFQWRYDDPAGEYGDYLYSTDRDLTVSYPAYSDIIDGATWFDSPQLNAYATPEKFESYTLDYPYIQVGGATDISMPDFGIYFKYGACNYNLSYGYATFADENNTPLFGYSSATNQLWTSIMGQEMFDVRINSIGNKFDKPTHSYVITKVSVLGQGEISADAKLTLTLKTVNDAGKISTEALATATCTGADILKTEKDGEVMLCIPFVFRDEQGEIKEVVISDAIIAFMSGFDENVTFGVYQTNSPDKYGECNAYVGFDFYYNNALYLENYPYTLAQLYRGDGYTFLFNLDATYPWLQCDETLVNASGDGEPVTVKLNSYYTSDRWTVSVEEGAQSWLSVSKNDRNLTFTAQPNDGDTRTAKVTVSAPACAALEFTVTQNKKTSIDNIGTDAGTVVTIADGLMSIQNAGTASYGKLYNISGMLVREFALQSGVNTVDLRSLTKGVYVLMLDDGTNVKIVR